MDTCRQNSTRHIIVIGGGPAGMMAAISAASHDNTKVILIEKNKTLGKKLTLTGGGRCNLTSAVSMNDFYAKIPRGNKFLHAAFHNLSKEMLLAFFEKHGTSFQIEGEKIYPSHESAQKIVATLEKVLTSLHVDVHFQETFLDFTTIPPTVELCENNPETKKKKIPLQKLHTVITDKRSYHADALILATGGASFPSTGSDGKVLSLLQKKEFELVPLKPALVQLFLTEDTSSLAGISLPFVNLSAKAGQKSYDTKGGLLFTGKGLSGPCAMDMSSYITPFSPSEVALYVDFVPNISMSSLEQTLFAPSKKQLSTRLSEYIPQRLAKFLLQDFDNRDVGNLKKFEKIKLLSSIKEFAPHLNGYGSLKEAIVSSGGISLNEISPSTMMSKKVDGLYFAGECMDVDALSGGYNLQIAFSTGYLAGMASSV